MSAPSHEVVSDTRRLGIGLTAAETGLTESQPAVLHEASYDALYALGIHGKAVTGADAFDALHVEPVVYLEGQRFELARDTGDQLDAKLAVIIPVRENGRTVDLVAWDIAAGVVATWRGAPLLGDESIDAPRIEIDGVRAYPGPLEWLRAGRDGVVILEPETARWRLAEERLIVRDAEFGRRLRQMLRLPEPRVFVESTGRAAA